MRNVLDRRIERLENLPEARPCADFAEQLRAAREHWRDDPEGARRATEERRRRFLAECAQAAAEERALSAQQVHLRGAFLRMEAAE
jgi:hypothetical protein